VTPSGNTTEQRRDKRVDRFLALLALGIALIGGVPGVISSCDYIGRRGLQVNFDPAQSGATGIDTTDPRFTNKVALVLYRINITGHGLQVNYVKDMSIEARVDGQWISTSRLIPKFFDATNAPGKFVYVRNAGPSGAGIAMLNWYQIGFEDKPIPLQFGEPLNFSYAALLNIEKEKFHNCDKLKIKVTDYLGRSYTSKVDVTPHMKYGFTNLFLVLD